VSSRAEPSTGLGGGDLHGIWVAREALGRVEIGTSVLPDLERRYRCA